MHLCTVMYEKLFLARLYGGALEEKNKRNERKSFLFFIWMVKKVRDCESVVFTIPKNLHNFFYSLNFILIHNSFTIINNLHTSQSIKL